MVRADFLERSRSYDFLVLLCATIFLGYAINTGQIVIRFNICAEVFDSAWVSGMMAIATNFLLGFFGFFLVKGAIERDGRTGVGQIMAATPLKKIEYVFGKWLSHFIILSALVIVLAAATALIQTFRLEGLDLIVLLSPFLWLSLPFMALVAAVAVLFETTPLIKGSLSNLIYFFLFVFLLVTVTNSSNGRVGMLTDPSGIRILIQEIKSAGLYCGEKTSLSELANAPAATVLSAGIAWNADILLSRLGTFVIALSLTAFSALLFNRFDASEERLRIPRALRNQKTTTSDENLIKPVETPVHLSPLRGSRTFQNNLPHLILAELRLMFKGNHWMWYIGAVLLWVFAFTASEKSITLWLIISAIWPLLIWSKMGIRESYYRTNQIVFSCSNPLWRLLFASWLAGVLVTALVWSGAGINLALHGQMANLIAWLIAVLLVPSLALMLGVWTGSSKTFEVFYLVIWYAGIANRLPALDFIGLTPEAIVIQHPAWILSISAICILFAFLGRRQKLYI
jgi:hypothetical protein